VLPYEGRAVASATALIDRVVTAHGFEPNIGMHADVGRCLYTYVALMFDRAMPGEDARAIACHDALLTALMAEGHYPFRLALPAQGALPAPSDATQDLVWALKRLLDPRDVLAPGRYDFRTLQSPE
jgi:4-cresol dehydrogenase (hydroxylating)